MKLTKTQLNKLIKRIEIIDGVKTIQGEVRLFNLGLTELPNLSDVTIIGVFDCSNNKLTSLKGCPKRINNDFYCHNNQLTTLHYAATQITGNFYCHDNMLTSLEYAPTHIIGSFYGYNNPWELGLNIPERLSPHAYRKLIKAFKETQAHLAYLKANQVNITATNIEL